MMTAFGKVALVAASALTLLVSACGSDGMDNVNPIPAPGPKP